MVSFQTIKSAVFKAHSTLNNKPLRRLSRTKMPKKHYINDLTPSQLDEYVKIAQLNNQGKFEEFSKAIKQFKIKLSLT